MKILFIQCNCVKNTKTLLLMVPGNGIDHRNKGIHIFLKSSWVNFFFFCSHTIVHLHEQKGDRRDIPVKFNSSGRFYSSASALCIVIIKLYN